MQKIIISTVSLVSLCLLFAFLNITTPANAGPFGILVIFTLAYLSSFGLMTFLLYGSSRAIAYISAIFIARKPLNKLSFKRSYLFSSILAASPVMFIGLKSVGAASVYGYGLIILFTAIGCLYISKRII